MHIYFAGYKQVRNFLKATLNLAESPLSLKVSMVTLNDWEFVRSISERPTLSKNYFSVYFFSAYKSGCTLSNVLSLQ